MLEDVEQSLEVWISVGIIRSYAVPRQMLPGRLVQAGSQLVGLRVPWESVSAPTNGTVPHTAAADYIDVDADDEGVVRFVSVADGHTVDAPTACCS